jgi:hypothetical protein
MYLTVMILLEKNNARVLLTVFDGFQPNNTLWNLFGTSGCTTDDVFVSNSMKHPTLHSDIYFQHHVAHFCLNASVIIFSITKYQVDIVIRS